MLSLPPLPVSQYSVDYLSNALDLEAALGGKTLRVPQIGDKFGLTIATHAVRYDQAVGVSADLNGGLSQKIRAHVPQGFSTGAPGAPKVNGAGQLGMTLALKGVTPGYVFRKGQFISFITGGVSYLHQLTATVTATAATVAIPIQPPLRTSPANDDVVAVANPVIEGYVTGNSNAWQVGVIKTAGVSFRIEEAE